MFSAITPSSSPIVSLSPNTATATSSDSPTHHARLLSSLTEHATIPQLKQVHAQALRTAVSPDDPTTLFLFSRILHFSSSLNLRYACNVFRQIQNPNSFMWNTLIRAFARSSDDKESAILFYRKMLEEGGGVGPDKHTFTFVLKACAYLFALSEGQQVHAQLLKLGLESDVYINNGLIHLYASCGCLELARDVFEDMPERNMVSWNVMIDAFVQFGKFDSALELFGEMQELFEPDGYTMQSVISACAGLGALSLGIWAHLYVLRRCGSNVAENVLVNNSLLDMYCKCGALRIAEQLFKSMPERDVNSWNAMILGYAIHGEAEKVLEYFSQMTSSKKVVPNSVTFVGVLNACNHRGMASEGRRYFDMMIRDFNIQPRIEHYGCLVDLLARAGLIDDALDIVSNMPIKPDAVIWRSLLDASCKKSANIELSEEMARQVFELEGDVCSGVYVLLSRIYASANRWNEVGLIRKLMTDKGVTKEPGCSSIEINGTTHEFFAGDTTHPQTKEIYQFLDEIEERLTAIGYSPDFSQAPMVDEIREGKQHALRLHSERLAIALGLLNLKPGIPIRVFKNLRVCNDCHQVTKLISRMYDVEIIVRDRTRFHHFKDGSCSCRDYW